MEELYLRGLLQNIIAKWFGERKNAILYAILITSVLFGLGHIFGALGQPIATVIAKTVPGNRTRHLFRSGLRSK
ncbi:MAG: type II CAAX prenyl endopeptidase Rce1 family protein [[Eubacterium] siraeum]